MVDRVLHDVLVRLDLALTEDRPGHVIRYIAAARNLLRDVLKSKTFGACPSLSGHELGKGDDCGICEGFALGHWCGEADCFLCNPTVRKDPNA